jgi:hypothetical protein
MADPGRKPTVSDTEILDVFRHASDPVLTTAEVAEQVDLGRRGTFDRLSRLAKENKIEMKKVGKSGAVWWFSESLDK